MTTTPPASGRTGRRAPALMTMPAPGDSLPVPIHSPVLTIAGDDTDRTAEWLDTLTRLWDFSGPPWRVTRVSAGPEEARATRARKTLIADVLTDAVSDHLAGRHVDTLFVVDLTGAYEHTGRNDDEAAASMGHSVVEAIKAARQVDGLPLIIVVDHLGDLPDSLRGFETIVTAGEPTNETSLRLATPPRRSSRPAQAPPAGHIWMTTGDENGWAPAPVSDGRARR